MRVANRVAEPELVEDKEAMMGVGFRDEEIVQKYCTTQAQVP